MVRHFPRADLGLQGGIPLSFGKIKKVLDFLGAPGMVIKYEHSYHTHRGLERML